MERVTWTVAIGSAFGAAAFDDAFAGFRQLYNVRPQRVRCAPDVLDRYALVFSRSGQDAMRRVLEHDGIPLVSALVPPGTIVFEGEVDDVKMGDW